MEKLSQMAKGWRRGFLSDNAAPVHPKVMQELAQINQGHVLSYGGDEVVQAAHQAFETLFGQKLWSAFVFNGTGANCIALSLCAPYGHQAVLCSDVAHIFTDECGAPEHMAGVKLLALPSVQGKITAAQVQAELAVLGNMHHAQPAVVSITQCTEYGTLYTTAEIREICDIAHRHGLYMHMDGARIANAAAAAGETLAAMTCRAGVDVLSFGGTKNGLMFGEAVLVFTPQLQKQLDFVRKNNGQLASKMRYVAAQYLVSLEEGLWLEMAEHANAQARRLGEGFEEAGWQTEYPVQANEVFLCLPQGVIAQLMKHQDFHVMDERRGLCRFVCSWDTQPSDIQALLSDVSEVMK